MAGTLILSEFTFRSGASSASYYYFTIVSDSSGNLSVRNLTAPTGLLQDSLTELPQSVTDDISSAYTTVEDFLASTSAISGEVTFTAETSKSVTFTTALNSATYSVFFDSDAFVPFKATSKATTGFTIEAGTTFTGTVRYNVFL